MMIRLTILFTLLGSGLFAQNYWQQEVNYKIQVELNDTNHTLTAFEEFEYINNSPDVLDKIYIHLWPNAYKNGKTALARQQYNDGKSLLKFGSEDIKGNIDSLDFKVKGQKTNWYYDPEHIDICIIELAQPLQPGEKTTISTPFTVKVPSGSISRLGHIGESYQITQWYPKPAVYDKNGWNQMPYLNQGEFYSEYGSFDVEITLPKNYVVGATGDLQTSSEIEFLNDRAAKTADAIQNGKNYLDFQELPEGSTFPLSSEEKKTIRYTQKNVHDFAWFADKRFNVLKSEVKLPHSGRMVTSWAMYTKRNAALWKNASEYLNDAIYYYSLWNGDYPYNNVTAVDGTISAGGGMEYPNVTVIGGAGSARDLEVVIVHEVGHNWFYGQLGTNERVHGWMDEGMNTLNEVRYMQTKYPENTALSDMVMGAKFHMEGLSHQDMSDISYRMMAAMGEDQPIETHSAHFSSANYGVVMYQKTGLVFYYLKDYLGDDLFDQSMQAYYKEWEFKHPQPEDMRRSLEKASGKDLGWLFEDLIQTTNHVDFKVKKVKDVLDGYTVDIKNKGQVNGPIEVNAMLGDSIVQTVWLDKGTKKQSAYITHEFDKIRIDAGKDTPELNRQNNIWDKNKLFKRMEPLKMELLLGDNEPEHTNIFWTPAVAGNAYDKLMIGAIVHNYGVPFNKFGYMIAPFYSVGRQMVSGVSEFSYTMLPKNTFKLSRFGLSVKSFKHDDVLDDLYRKSQTYFVSVAPYWTAKIGNRKKDSPFTHNIRVQSLYRKDQYGDSTSIEHAGGYIQYDFGFKRPDHVINIQLRNEYLTNVNSSDEMARILFEATYKLRYLRNKKERWIEIRGFAGQQYIRNFDPSIGYQYSMSLSGTDGKQDLFVDEYYFGRNKITGMWSQQRDENMGSFKSSSYYGTTSIAMFTGNVYMQLPIKPKFIGAFFDAGIFDNGTQWNTAFNAGLGIRLGDFFGIYFPMWMSEELNNSFGSEGIFDDYGKKIRFTLKFNIINKPMNLSSFI